jgi:hypothetical protein
MKLEGHFGTLISFPFFIELLPGVIPKIKFTFAHFAGLYRKTRLLAYAIRAYIMPIKSEDE